MSLDVTFRSGIYKYLTLVSSKKAVKGVIAVILDYRLVLVLHPGQKLEPSVQQHFGFSTIGYCRETLPH